MGIEFEATVGRLGARGLTGAQMIQVTAAPTAQQGNDGDWAIWKNGSDTLLYGPKASGVWPAAQSIRGPVGATGKPPDHEWVAKALRFRQGDGTWGDLVNLLGLPGGVTSLLGLAGIIDRAGLMTALALVKADVGLGNVDNTSDASKPVSTAQQAALNLKGDYEEGVWTPTLSFGTPGTSSFSYTAQDGTFMRIGDWITLTMVLAFTPTIGTGAGNLLIGGLPYAMTVNTRYGGVVSEINNQWSWPAGCSMLAATPLSSSTTQFAIRAMGAAVNSTFLAASNMTNAASHNLRCMMTYRRA